MVVDVAFVRYWSLFGCHLKSCCVFTSPMRRMPRILMRDFVSIAVHFGLPEEPSLGGMDKMPRRAKPAGVSLVGKFY